MKIIISTLLITLIGSHSFAQSFNCKPQRVTFASNGGSMNTVEETSVNWSNIIYHITGETAVAMTFKDPDALATKANPTQVDQLAVIKKSEDQIVMLGGNFEDTMWLTTDVIFPKDGNGYSFYVSDYPKSIGGDLINLSKLYMLKCKEILSQGK